MKKIYIILGFVLILFASLFVLLFLYKDNEIEEVAYSIKTSYSYLSDGKVDFDIKLYSNKKDGLLAYPNEAIITLEDKKRNNVIELTLNDYQIDSTINYQETVLYQYVYGFTIEINSLFIENCYLRVSFLNESYLFNIGSFEIIENNYDKCILKITNLYGLTNDENNKSLKAIVMTFKNDTAKNVNISEIKIGSNYKMNLGGLIETEVKESNDIDDYFFEYNQNMNVINDSILLKNNETKTIVIPIKYLKDLYLYNCYLLFKIDGIYYYFNNFSFIESNDLNTMNKYLEMAKIYGA